eukprot:2234468-Pleurochrysis_carterae.AAC.2
MTNFKNLLFKERRDPTPSPTACRARVPEHSKVAAPDSVAQRRAGARASTTALSVPHATWAHSHPHSHQPQVPRKIDL